MNKEFSRLTTITEEIMSILPPKYTCELLKINSKTIQSRKKKRSQAAAAAIKNGENSGAIIDENKE